MTTNERHFEESAISPDTICDWSIIVPVEYSVLVCAALTARRMDFHERWRATATKIVLYTVRGTTVTQMRQLFDEVPCIRECELLDAPMHAAA